MALFQHFGGASLSQTAQTAAAWVVVLKFQGVKEWRGFRFGGEVLSDVAKKLTLHQPRRFQPIFQIVQFFVQFWQLFEHGIGSNVIFVANSRGAKEQGIGLFDR